MWMGGPVPLGYRLEDRKLLVEPGEAELIRHIFARYVALGSGRLVVAELDRDGIRSKARINRHGRAYGRQPISRGALYAILKNRLYIGEVVHKGQCYPGQHDAIVATDLFDTVQRMIADRRTEQRLGTRAASPSLLAGLLWDGHGRRMSPSHAVKHNKRYRYYVSQVESDADQAAPSWRIPAADIEALVVSEVRAAITDASQQAITSGRLRGEDIEVLRDRCGAVLTMLEQATPSRLREQLLALVTRIDIGEGGIKLALVLTSVDEHLIGTVPLLREIAIGFARTSRQVKIVIPPPTEREQLPNPSLLKLVAQAFAACAELDRSGGFDEVAARLGYGREYLSDMLRTSYLSPTIIGAIVEGRQPASLSRKQLVQTSRIPNVWHEQERLFGIG